MTRRRGDDIPPVSAYAHWNEDAQRVWYEENRYDMEHADEIIEDEDDYGRDEPDPFSDEFATEDEARRFALNHDAKDRDISEWAGKWYVEHYDKAAHERLKRKRGHH